MQFRLFTPQEIKTYLGWGQDVAEQAYLTGVSVGWNMKNINIYHS